MTQNPYNLPDLTGRGGIIPGGKQTSHDNGGVKYELADTGTVIEEEGLEINIPREIAQIPGTFTFTGTNIEILDKILTLGGLSIKDKVTVVKGEDIVICIKSSWDIDVRTYTGTIMEILSAINTSCGCKHIEDGANVIEHNSLLKEGGKIGYAPNGEKSNLNDTQWKLVRTSEFKKWFGDWENDPENSSKILDENGEPLVVYHGTFAKFNVFDRAKIGFRGENYEQGNFGGFYFSDNLENSKSYFLRSGSKFKAILKNILSPYKTRPFFLSIKNPVIVDAEGRYWNRALEVIPAQDEDESWEEYIKKYPTARNEYGYYKNTDTVARETFNTGLNDGVVFKNIIDTADSKLFHRTTTTVVAFFSEQIKLADGTNITFELNNPDIRKELGGEIVEDEIVLNGEGGYDYSGEANKIAKTCGLITLPKSIEGTNCGNCIFFKDNFCDHYKILLPVTSRQCCGLWDKKTLGSVFRNIWDAYLFPNKDFDYPLNDRGGYDYSGKALERARAVDLITLPEDIKGTTCAVNNCMYGKAMGESGQEIFCNHPKINLPVTDRMSCGWYDNKDIIREWGKPVELEFMRRGGKISAKQRIKDWQAENPNSPRWRKKKDSIMQLANGVQKLRLNVSKDLASDDDKTFLTALAIAIMDKTGERVGNETSADNGHFGVTVFKKKHIKVEGDKIYFDYKGKAGVEQEKDFSDARIAKALKRAIKNTPSQYIFVTPDGFKIKRDTVDRYLKDYNISPKALRGYFANRNIVKLLTKAGDKWKREDGNVEKEKRARRKIFNKAVADTAKLVGHGKATLKKHYMIPELPSWYIDRGQIINIKKLGYYRNGGELGDIAIADHYVNDKKVPEEVQKTIDELFSNYDGVKPFFETQPVENLSFDELIPTQDFLKSDKFEKLEEGKEKLDTMSPAYIIEHEAKLYVFDGHHRNVKRNEYNLPISGHIYNLTPEFKRAGKIPQLDKKGTLFRKNEFIKYEQNPDQKTYNLTFYKLHKTKGKSPQICDTFGDCKIIDPKKATSLEVISYITQNKFFKAGGITSALKKGISVEREHKDLYLQIKNRLQQRGIQMPISEKEFYENIAKAHLKEKKNYYDLIEKFVEDYSKPEVAKDTGGMIYIYNDKEYNPSQLIEAAKEKSSEVHSVQDAIRNLGRDKIKIKGLGKHPSFQVVFKEGGSMEENMPRKIGDTIKYKNKYGFLELELVTDYRPISGIRGSNLPDNIKFSLDTAEQIALITENKMVQLSPEFPNIKKWYIVVHNSPSVAAVAKIKSIYFDEKINAAKELAQAPRYYVQPEFKSATKDVLSKYPTRINSQGGFTK